MKTETKTETGPELSPEVREILADLPPIIIERGERTHPLFKQWRKMIEACSNPKDSSFANFGGRGITVAHRWYTFANFVEDMGPTFEFEPSKPPMLRRNYLARRNLKAGFNPKNAYWGTRSEAVQIQSKTVFVDTPFGKQMTLRELAEYLAAHEGEPLPSSIRPPKYHRRSYNVIENRWERELITIDTIVPIKLVELRRRHNKGLCLITPPRPYGENREDNYEPPPPSAFRQVTEEERELGRRNLAEMLAKQQS